MIVVYILLEFKESRLFLNYVFIEDIEFVFEFFRISFNDLEFVVESLGLISVYFFFSVIKIIVEDINFYKMYCFL